MAKVFVGMSGGVDSSVSAALLKKEGHDVVGVFIKTWHPPFLTCTWREERQDAMAVCAKLGIPFQTMDLEEEYKREVVDYMIAEYRQGRTPNPDVMCNDKIKFGAFFKAAQELGADFVATGHYARVERREKSIEKSGNDMVPSSILTRCSLLAGIDTNKDQSYFLWRVRQEVLEHVLFPVGAYEKPKVREIARDCGLAVADKKDSQGVCFLGDVDMQDFLKHYIDVQVGDVIDENGKKIGTHNGAVLYTLGQRHGFTVTDKSPTDGAFYVVSKDVSKNTITVSAHLKTSSLFDVSRVGIEDTNWIASTVPDSGSYRARFRYRQPLQSCTFDASTNMVVFTEPQKSIALGQSLVLYRDDELLGGGVVTVVS